MPSQKHPEAANLEALLEALAANLREARARSNWSTRVLSQQSQVDRRTIQRIQDGSFPGVSLGTLEALATGLGVQTSSLVGPRLAPRQSGAALAAEVLPANLVSARLGHGMSQEALAAASGVPRSVIAAIETGTRNPALSTLARLAGALGTTVEQLLAEG